MYVVFWLNSLREQHYYATFVLRLYMYEVPSF